MKVKINLDNDDLWCLYSKEKIEIGEKYAEIEEDCLSDIIIKTYKLECCPLEDEDDIYLGENYD